MSHRRIRSLGILAAFLLGLGALPRAVTPVPSADGQFWDIQDTSSWAQDSGGIATGGHSYPFNGFGYLKVQVRRADGSAVVTNRYLHGFGLSYDGEGRFDSLTPILSGEIVIARSLYAPSTTDYLRYFDTFTNVSGEIRIVEVVWGGACGAYKEGGLVAVAATSSGDRRIDPADSFVTVMQNTKNVEDPSQGPSGHGPSAHVLGTSGSGAFVAVGDMYSDPFTATWPGFDPAHIGYVFRLTLQPKQTLALLTFVVKGRSETYDPRGGVPVSLKDAIVAPHFDPVYSGPEPMIPAPGSEISKVTDTARRLVQHPDLQGLTPRQLRQIANWKIPGLGPMTDFSVVEKTTPELQEALTQGITTSEDLVQEYLTRLTTFDRNGPTFRSMLSIDPMVFAAARQSDAERSVGRVRGAFHGVPVAFKDNIDATDLPTTGGSRALIAHRSSVDAHIVAGMRQAGAIVLGKTNLDEFPFGDFGISSVGGTVGNAYDPTLSTAGSSGGSAVAVSTSLVALGFGTDTCNSLSNPSSFASLATIRTTRGLTSRAGVMPLNTYNDAVGPMAKSVRELALVLDQVTGTDPEDPATKDADKHRRESFAARLGATSLKGARLGFLRQRFVGFTGEHEAAQLMERVKQELEAAGATVVDVTIHDLDAAYRSARGSAPGSLRSAWNAYLARGVKAGARPLTIEDLLSSGRLAPESAAVFENALKPVPTGDALHEATEKFYAGRDAFRHLFEKAMDDQRLDGLMYPGNLARPHTHEGGLERYGSEPGTCEESAMTGLPQVTVPAGFLGDRYPFGVSFLGRFWSDQRMLDLGFAYEQATHHRRPPSTVN